MMHQVLPEKEVSPLADASQDQLTGKWNETELGTQLAGWLTGRLAGSDWAEACVRVCVAVGEEGKAGEWGDSGNKYMGEEENKMHTQG